MRVSRSLSLERRGVARGVVAAWAVLALAGCMSANEPVGPSGEAAYSALATPVEPVDFASGYALQPGDTVSVNVFGEPDLTVEETLLDNSGNIGLPLIGDVAAAGLTARELGERIETLYGARYLRDPRVSVTVEEAREPFITVEGEVEQPGNYPYAPGQSLLIALAQARSPTEVAALGDVFVFRNVDGERLGGRFDVKAIRAGRMPDFALLPGDVVVVGHSARRAALRDVLRVTPILGVLRPI